MNWNSSRNFVKLEGKGTGKWSTYFSTSFVIMKVHQTASVTFHLPGIAKSLSQRCAEDHIGRTSAPLPSRMWLRCGSTVLTHVASARMDGAAAASEADRVSDRSAPNGVKVRGFATAYSILYWLMFVFSILVPLILTFFFEDFFFLNGSQFYNLRQIQISWDF